MTKQGNHRWAATIIAAILLMLAASIAAPAQTLTTLHSFDYTDGANPLARMIQTTNGNLYGTTAYGALRNGDGTVFQISPDRTLTTLHRFCSRGASGCTDGSTPLGALVQATNGNLYGTTVNGGAGGGGTVFKITPSGILTILHSFCAQGGGCSDGLEPEASLVQGTDGNFYGTTQSGGTNGFGTIFKITPSGILSTMYAFCSQSSCADGAVPLSALAEATNGNFYGTTYAGGVNNHGTVFKISPSGTLTTLYSFCSQSSCDDGQYPQAALVQATDGNFYGTTFFGGANLACASNGSPAGCGTIFKITPTGNLTTLYSFCIQTGCPDGQNPGLVVQATDRNLYGTTQGGGAVGTCFAAGVGCGTAFKITPSGAMTTLYSFCSQSNCADGANPDAALAQDTDGTFYGTTHSGGASGACTGGCGTVFSLAVGLGAFLQMNPASGKVGEIRHPPGNESDGRNQRYV